MDKQELLMLFEKQASSSSHCDPFSLASAYAETLSEIAGRLSQEEVKRLIQIGAGIYECGIRESGRGIPPEDLLPASECWASKIKSSIYQ